MGGAVFIIMKKALLFIILISLISVLIAPSVLAIPAWKQQPTTPTTPTAPVEPQVIYVNQTVAVPVEDEGINWEMIGVIIVIIAGIVGWIISRLVRGKTAKYMSEIDGVYRKYNKNTNRCEAELTNLREKIDNDFKKGKLTDQALGILEKRIEKYSRELRSDIIGSKFQLPSDLSGNIKKMLADGVITKEEYSHFKDVLGKANMGSKEKEELNNLMKKWKDSDKK